MAYRPNEIGAQGTSLEGIIQAMVANQQMGRDPTEPGYTGPEITYRPMTESLAEAGYANPQDYRDYWEQVQPLVEQYPNNADLQIWRNKVYPLPDRFYDEDYSTKRDPARGHPGYGTDQQQAMNPGSEDQYALDTGGGEGGGDGGGSGFDLHAQWKHLNEGWEGPWTPVFNPAILGSIIRQLSTGGGLDDGARVNWFAGR